MNTKEIDPRLTEAMREQKPPVLRCWVNEHSQAMLLDHEAHVIFESIEGESKFDIVSRDKIIYLGISKRGDAIGPYRDAYVHVKIIPDYSNEEDYMIQSWGSDGFRIMVVKDQVVFAQPADPIWDEIKIKLEEEAEGQIPEFRVIKGDQIAINAIDGSARPLRDY